MEQGSQGQEHVPVQTGNGDSMWDGSHVPSKPYRGTWRAPDLDPCRAKKPNPTVEMEEKRRSSPTRHWQHATDAAERCSCIHVTEQYWIPLALPMRARRAKQL